MSTRRTGQGLQRAGDLHVNAEPKRGRHEESDDRKYRGDACWVLTIAAYYRSTRISSDGQQRADRGSDL